MASPAADKEEELEEDLEVNIEDEEKFIPVRDGDKEPDPEEVEEPDTFEPISGMNITGRNFASVTFNKVENQILDAYQSLGDQEDRSIFEDYLLTNLKLYFDKYEAELSTEVDEPTTDAYEKEQNQLANKEVGAEDSALGFD